MVLFSNSEKLKIQYCLAFSEPINLIDVYGEMQLKHPNFTNQDLNNEIATLLITVSAIITIEILTLFG